MEIIWNQQQHIFKSRRHPKFLTGPASNGMKIIYAGIRNDNYDPGRAGSFEYQNFYLYSKRLQKKKNQAKKNNS